MKPIVLVHGAFHGGWCWDKVRDALGDRAGEVITPDLPMRTVDGDIAVVAKILDELADDAVVAGHSYGGVVISGATSGRTDVAHLVYVCAAVPDRGEDVLAGLRNGQPDGKRDGFTREDDGTLHVDGDLAPKLFYGDVDPEESAAAIARLRPFAAHQPFGDIDPGWKTIPSTYALCEQDRAIDPRSQEHLAKRTTAVRRWDTSHSPMLSRPDLVADLLVELAS